MPSLRQIADRAEVTIEDVEAFLDSPAGRRFRHLVANGLIVAAPLVANLPVVKRTAFGRVVIAAGGAALIVRVAEAIRDWETDGARQGETRVRSGTA